jgi:hypothetical protein
MQLLRLLNEHSDAVEADLSRYHGLDYRDRWRFDAEGRRVLTLRMISARVKHLPADSATSHALGGSGWRVGDYLLAHLFQATCGEPHPALPESQIVADPAREKRRLAGVARAHERQRAIDSGEIT